MIMFSEERIKRFKLDFFKAYIVVFGVFYIIVPLIFMGESVERFTLQLASLTMLSVIGFGIGLLINFFPNFSKRYFVVPSKTFSWLVYGAYAFIIAVTILTAGEIPIIASFRGADQVELILLRESFLKEREGAEALLSYIITLLDTTFFPLVVLYSFATKSKYRWLFLGTFIFYSISFLEKAYFLKIGIPMFFYFYYQAKNKKSYLLISGSVLISIIFAMFLVSKFDSSVVVREDPFFSIYYTPTTITQAVIWRIIAVPVVTAYQGIELFYSSLFRGDYFMGATSSTISGIFGIERINFERVLYQTQFGGSATANANQFYVVEAFVNFGYVGVLMFSYIFGKFVKEFINTRNITIICIIPVLYYNLFNSGLIGNLLSNGFLFFYIFITKVKFK